MKSGVRCEYHVSSVDSGHYQPSFVTSYVNPQTCSGDEDEDRLPKVCKLTSASQVPLENLMSHLSRPSRGCVSLSHSTSHAWSLPGDKCMMECGDTETRTASSLQSRMNCLCKLLNPSNARLKSVVLCLDRPFSWDPLVSHHQDGSPNGHASPEKMR